MILELTRESFSVDELATMTNDILISGQHETMSKIKRTPGFDAADEFTEHSRSQQNGETVTQKLCSCADKSVT